MSDRNGGGSVEMKMKTLSLFLALLVVLLFILSPAAFAGIGCGTNWMGDTSGDTDFYVSKNQNLAGTTSSDAPVTSSAKAVALGSTVKAQKNVDENATISSIKVSQPGPQLAGTAIVWTVVASNPGNEQMLYDFQLMGPSTGGMLRDMTGWIENNTWTWNTSDADVGENKIEILVTRVGSAQQEGSKLESYVIGEKEENNDAQPVDVTPGATASDSITSASAESTGAVSESSGASEVADASEESKASEASASTTASSVGDDHIVSKTADSMESKPRVAPDERKVTTATTTGPNMQMPDPSPKPLNQNAAGDQASMSEDSGASKSEQPSEPEPMDAEGKWSLKLEGSGITINPISLIQTGSSLMCMGTLNEDSLKLQVNGKGTVSGNTMSLEVWTVIAEFGNQIDRSVELDLTKQDGKFSGDYKLYSGDELLGKGNATASKLA